jgi:hypothetical protein
MSAISYNVLYNLTFSTPIVEQPKIVLHAIIMRGDGSIANSTTRNVTIKPSVPDKAPSGFYINDKGKTVALTTYLSELDEDLFPFIGLSGDVYFSIPLIAGETYLNGLIQVL